MVLGSIGTKDGSEENDTPVLPRQIKYEPGFFLEVLAQNGTFANRNLNAMRKKKLVSYKKY